MPHQTVCFDQQVSAASIAQSIVPRVLVGATLLSRAFTGLRLFGHADQAEYTENRSFLKPQSSDMRLGEGFSSSGL